MTISDEITKLNINLTNSYTACQNKGATMPANQNFDNLATCVSSIPTATEPTLASLTVTPSTTAQTITPPSGTDGYNTVTVSAVTAAIDSDIVAGNIKSGVEILGVNGTVTELVGTTTTITQNGTYAPASPSNGFTSVSVNVAGTTPSGTYTITANGTYDVTNYASADVSVSGGGGSSVNYAVTTDGFILPIGADYSETYNETTSVTISAGYSDGYIGCLPCDLQILSSDKNMDVSMRSIFLKYLVFALTEIAKSRIFEDAYAYNENLEKVDFSSLQTISGSNVFIRSFVDCTKLSEIKFDNLQTISGSSCFVSRPFKGTAIINISFPKLSILTGRYALGGSAGTGGAFANCTSLQTLSFPALTSTSFGSNTNQFNYMLNGVAGCTVHFPSNLQSVIGSWSSVTSGFGGTNTIVLFDLPATT